MEKYMKRAIKLAEKGVGYVSPNPLVGAVIVKNNYIIGEGYHEKYGEPHAEMNAFYDVDNRGNSAENATMYVTLEPCFHFGKTSPCVGEIVKRKLKKVVIGILDPNLLVNGKSLKFLEENNIEIKVGMLSKDIQIQNEIFLKYITTKKPYCIMKSAMTLDGKIASYRGDSKWISNKKSRIYVHSLRHKVTSIMIGINTLIEDNPRLNTRLDIENPSDSVKIILDSRGRIPLSSYVLNNKFEKSTIVATTEQIDRKKKKLLEDKGVEVIVTSSKDGKVNLNELMIILGRKGIDSVLIEGGGSVNFEALRSEIVDKIEMFISPKIIGGVTSKTPVEGEGISLIKNAIKLKNISYENFDEDILVRGYI